MLHVVKNLRIQPVSFAGRLLQAEEGGDVLEEGQDPERYSSK